MNAKDRAKSRSVPAVLTIAGSDSGGGAGIQADLKTFTALRVFGTSAVTCITSQNPDAVTGILAIDPAVVRSQIRAVCTGFPISAAKTGMLFSSEIIDAVAKEVKLRRIRNLVVDPVMIATSGVRLLQPQAVTILCDRLLPLARVVTPNLPEAEVLADMPIRKAADLSVAAARIARRCHTACVVKGGHLRGKIVEDILVDAGRVCTFAFPRITARETHGTGCTFSAALAAFLAKGLSLPEAVRLAKAFVFAALTTALPVGRHWPLNFFRGR